MTERYWVEQVLKDPLATALPEFTVQAEQKLPYAHEIRNYSRARSEGAQPSPTKGDEQSRSFAIDLLVGEREGAAIWRPRVAVEVKLRISTHSAITYSQKAADHRAVSPYLRYGILAVGFKSLPWRLLRHGTHFDFMVSLRDKELPHSDVLVLTNLVRQEVEASRQLEALLYESRGHKTTLLHRALTLRSTHEAKSP